VADIVEKVTSFLVESKFLILFFFQSLGVSICRRDYLH